MYFLFSAKILLYSETYNNIKEVYSSNKRKSHTYLKRMILKACFRAFIRAVACFLHKNTAVC